MANHQSHAIVSSVDISAQSQLPSTDRGAHYKIIRFKVSLTALRNKFLMHSPETQLQSASQWLVDCKETKSKELAAATEMNRILLKLLYISPSPKTRMHRNLTSRVSNPFFGGNTLYTLVVHTYRKALRRKSAVQSGRMYALIIVRNFCLFMY